MPNRPLHAQIKSMEMEARSLPPTVAQPLLGKVHGGSAAWEYDVVTGRPFITGQGVQGGPRSPQGADEEGADGVAGRGCSAGGAGAMGTSRPSVTHVSSLSPPPPLPIGTWR